MTRWGMVIDLDKCVACQSCMAACSQENNVPIPEPVREGVGGRGHQDIRWNSMLAHGEAEHGTPPTKETGELDPMMELMPRPCFHCWDATCVKVCPVRATYIDEEGLVGQDYTRCIGCRICTVGCPYSVRQFNWERPEWPSSMKNMLNPDVPVRPKHVVEKCSFCYNRLRVAKTEVEMEGRELEPEGEYVPACVEACPTDAIHFGDVDDRSTEVHELKNSSRAHVFLPELGQKPKVWYLEERE